jgi:hypothetical protein
VGSDVLSRFLTSERHYSKKDKRVKPNAFLPGDDRVTSTYHSTGLAEDDIWSLARTHVRVHRIYGRGDVTVSSVMAAGLAVDPDYEPARHVNITGWPEDVADHLSFAQSLAAEATLCLNPEA